jgi:hypothetical protein
MTATHRDYSRAEVVRLLREREEIEEMQRSYAEWRGQRGEWRRLRWQDRAIIGVVMVAGCACWLGAIWLAARGGLW